MLINRNQKLALIHLAKKKLHIHDEDYVSILIGAAGVDSASYIETEAQYENIMKAFKNLGFKKTYTSPLKKNSETVPGNSSNMISKKQEYYIKGLWDLASRAKDETSLRHIIKRIAKVDDIRFLPRDKAQAVILALRDVCKKAGFNPDRK